jgi:hypothetical protein
MIETWKMMFVQAGDACLYQIVGLLEATHFGERTHAL